MQPGRFTTIGGSLTFHIADRKPNGLLVGIFVDDRRDPNEHATYLAEQGQTLKNDTGTFLVLEKGSIQRLQAGQRDPRIITFDRYAFDLSKFASGPQNIVYTAREKFILDLLNPPEDPSTPNLSNEYRSEFHDRLASPLYPLAFIILTFTFLGPPQTTRQSRTLASLNLIAAIAALRLIGFLSIIIGVRIPPFSPFSISRSSSPWPPEFGKYRAAERSSPSDCVTKLAAVIGQRLARPATS